jgi:eukaryotic-like serine/threonine-protein kinase
MASTDASPGDPTRLPPGTRVGPWELREWRGRGSYGTVYRAVRWGAPEVAEVALKLASHAEDPRFAREVALLSRLRHPSVPRLFDRGEWLNASGRAHPYLVMEWVEGVSLYAWATRHAPTSRQVIRVLSQVASALAQTVEAGAVHRDVKGDNILVQGGAEGHAFLMDYGSGYYAGAERLTPPLFPPATPRYRSPEAWAYAQRAGLDAERPYEMQPADDVFALGVSAYRLVTGTYPPPTEPWDAASQVWNQDGRGPRSPQELNPRVAPHLSALILRMLAARPEHRLAARDLARALDEAAKQAGPDVDQALRSEALPERSACPPAMRGTEPGSGPPALSAPKVRKPGSLVWTALATVPVAVGVGWWLQSWLLPAGHAVAVTAKRSASSVAAADTALMAPPASEVPTGREGIALELPQKPFPGQQRPDSAGKCPRKTQRAIHNGCWVKLDVPKDACEDGYLYKGGCYMPAFRPAPAPTSHPAASQHQKP